MFTLVYAVLLFFLFFQSNYYKGSFNPDYLSSEQTIQWRGFLAIWVLMEHCIGSANPFFVKMDCILSFLPFSAASVPMAVFFFLSGYGVQKAFIASGEQYRKSYPHKRVASLLLPYIVLIIIYWGFNVAFYGSYSVSEACNSFLTGLPMVTFSWYLIVSAIFYILYYFQMCLFEKRNNLIITVNFILCLLWVFVVKLLGWGYWWYGCTSAIPLGIFWATYEPLLLPLIKKQYKLLLSFTVITFYAALLLYHKHEIMILWQIMNYSFIALLLLFSLKFSFHSKVLTFLGTVSMEIYVIHGIFTAIMVRFVEGQGGNPSFFLPAVLSGSIVSAFFLHKLFSAIKTSYLKAVHAQ